MFDIFFCFPSLNNFMRKDFQFLLSKHSCGKNFSFSCSIKFLFTKKTIFVFCDFCHNNQVKALVKEDNIFIEIYFVSVHAYTLKYLLALGLRKVGLRLRFYFLFTFLCFLQCDAGSKSNLNANF